MGGKHKMTPPTATLTPALRPQTVAERLAECDVALSAASVALAGKPRSRALRDARDAAELARDELAIMILPLRRRVHDAAAELPIISLELDEARSERDFHVASGLPVDKLREVTSAFGECEAHLADLEKRVDAIQKVLASARVALVAQLAKPAFPTRMVPAAPPSAVSLLE